MKTDYSKLEMFRPIQGYDYGVRLAKEIDVMFEDGRLSGRMANRPYDYGILAHCVAESGDLPYVETGTLYGASLMIAAKTKQKYGLKGTCYGIDPLNGYYPGQNTLPDNKDPLTGLVPSPEMTLRNLETLDITKNAVLVTQESVPFPRWLSDTTFGCAFIDGDHQGEMPRLDWLNFKNRTKHYIVFDNYDMVHDAVRKAVTMAARDPDWDLVHISSIIAVFKRKI